MDTSSIPAENMTTMTPESPEKLATRPITVLSRERYTVENMAKMLHLASSLYALDTDPIIENSSKTYGIGTTTKNNIGSVLRDYEHRLSVENKKWYDPNVFFERCYAMTKLNPSVFTNIVFEVLFGLIADPHTEKYFELFLTQSWTVSMCAAGHVYVVHSIRDKISSAYAIDYLSIGVVTKSCFELQGGFYDPRQYHFMCSAIEVEYISRQDYVISFRVPDDEATEHSRTRYIADSKSMKDEKTVGNTGVTNPIEFERNERLTQKTIDRDLIDSCYNWSPMQRVEPPIEEKQPVSVSRVEPPIEEKQPVSVSRTLFQVIKTITIPPTTHVGCLSSIKAPHSEQMPYNEIHIKVAK